MFSKKSKIFLGLTFSFSWGIAIAFHLSGGKWNTPQALAVATLYMLVPMLSAIFVQKRIFRESVKDTYEISFKINRWFLAAWLAPFVMAIIAGAIGLLARDVEFSSDMAGMYERFKDRLSPEKLEEMRRQMAGLPVHPFIISLAQGLVAGFTINALFAFGEELGWRGLLLKELEHLGFWKSSFLIGVIWGVWHAPIILQGHNFPDHPRTGVFVMIIACVFLSPIFGYFRIRARSTIAAAIVHGSFNATPGLALMFLKGGSDLWAGVTGFAGILAMAVILGGIVIYDRRFSGNPLT
jgi:membrane protease YdiL (CAAX protease family)